jgi:hypothetical protein
MKKWLGIFVIFLSVGTIAFADEYLRCDDGSTVTVGFDGKMVYVINQSASPQNVLVTVVFKDGTRIRNTVVHADGAPSREVTSGTGKNKVTRREVTGTTRGTKTFDKEIAEIIDCDV